MRRWADTTGGDQVFTFSAARTPGALGEVVVANLGGSSIVSLYLDADNNRRHDYPCRASERRDHERQRFRAVMG
jgi:hypothetical protein